MKDNSYKTIYLLGAGFSIDAGSPPQKDIVKEIFSTLENDFEPTVKSDVKKFREFLLDNMNIPIDLHNSIPLEDIFTPLDRCLADNIAFRGLSVTEVSDMRNLINYLIGQSFQKNLVNADSSYIRRFASYIVEKASIRSNGQYKNFDPISIISTNWDILLDNELNSCIQYTLDSNGKSKYDGVVDYCCHISSYSPYGNQIMPGLEKLGMGGFNVKFLKLHGSLNWLICPRCQRLYVEFDNKIAVNQYELRETCRHCKKNFKDEVEPVLISNLTMPTFLKNFSNTQYKLIWQNAGIELSEASKIVFIGYSLPYADFELRQLLSRMVRRDAVIEVIDFDKDDESEVIKQITERYKIFFGERFKGKVYCNGAKTYIMEHHDFSA